MKRVVSIYLCLFFALGVVAQQGVREEVYLHVNSTYLLAGETLHYSAFVTEYGSSSPTELSKILYVELVGENDNRIFQHKVPLDEGRGYADFFVPTLVPTGSYYLVAYTRWMKNFESYFQIPVTIINPFDKYEIPKADGLKVEFSAKSGGLVFNQTNDFIIQITNNHQPYQTSGRIVNGEGTKVANVQTDTNGIAQINFSPKQNENYQLIIENLMGEFEFFKVPIAAAETSIHMDEYPGFYQIKVSSNSSSELFQVFDGESLLLERTIQPNQSFQLSKSELKSTGPFIAKSREASHIFGSINRVPEPIQIGKYTTRSKVEIPLQLEGNFSVSVHAVNEQPTPTISSASWNNRTLPISEQIIHWKGANKLPDSVKYLPELRGEIISGKVSPSLSGETIVFSTIDSVFQFRPSVISPTGEFNIQIEPMYENKSAYLTVIEKDSVGAISTYSNFYESYLNLSFPEVVIDSVTAYRLTERSIKNQIENAYYEVPAVVPQQNIYPFQFGRTLKTYVLDDYNRFPKMSEHFVEYIPEVVARQNKSRSKIKVLMEYLMSTDLPPIIVIDGLPTKAEEILDFSPYKIQSIDVSQNRIFLGPLVFDGLVSFHTFTNDLYSFKPGSNSQNIPYQSLEPRYNYEYPDYADDKRTEVDYRRQLYWNPELKLDSSDTLEFYTSDLTGTFEVIIEGYNAEGKPVSLKKEFEVTTSSPDAN